MNTGCIGRLVSIADPCVQDVKIPQGTLDITSLYPDFSWPTVDAITDRASATAELEMMRWAAMQFVTQDVTSAMASAGLRLAQMEDTVAKTGEVEICANTDVPTLTAPLRGVGAKLTRCAPNSLKRLTATALELWSKEDYDTVDITVVDGVETYTITASDVKAGRNDVFALSGGQVGGGVISMSNELSFYVDATQYSLYPTKQYCTCDGNAYSYYVRTWNGTRWMNGRGLTGTGLIATFTTICNYDELLCIMAATPQTKWLVLYKMGQLLGEKMLSTNRMNAFTVGAQGRGEYLIEKYSNLYTQKYKELGTAIKSSLSLYGDGECIHCKTNIKQNI